MLKKTLLSLAIATSTVGLTACNISSVADNNTVITAPITAGTVANQGKTTPVFSAARRTLPLQNDFLFLNGPITDGTASAGDSAPPVTTALNSISGSSTVAPIDIEFTAGLDTQSIQALYSVNLIKLRNADDDARIDALDLLGSIIPVSEELGLSIFADEQPVFNVDYTVSFLELDNGATQNLRINLINPLEAKTKYIVSLTNQIKDFNGDDLAPSSEYSLLSADIELVTPLFEPLRALIQPWENITTSFFEAEPNTSLGKDDIILSYAFTTGGTSDVLTAVAAPQIFVEQQASQPASAERLIFGFVRAQNLPADPTVDDRATANAAGAEAILEVVRLAAAEANFAFANDENPTAAEIAAVKATEEFKVAIVAAAGDRVVEITNNLAKPEGQTVKFIERPLGQADQSPTLLTQLGRTYGVSTAGITTPSSPDIGLRFVQGKIELPVGLSAPSLTNPEALASLDAVTISNAVRLSFAQDSVWEAADELSPLSDNMKVSQTTGLSSSEGVTEVTDADGNVTGFIGGMTNVTYRYPLVKLDEKISVPFLMTVPSRSFPYGQVGGQSCNLGADGKYPVIIYAHAVTADRASSIGVGTAMGVNCYVTIAIDLPAHGVAPISNNADGSPVDNVFLGFNVENGGTLKARDEGDEPVAVTYAEFANQDSDFDIVEERHRNLAAAPGSSARIAMDFDGTATTNGTDETPSFGNSGSFFFNIGNLGRLRDNIRQGVVDLMHLNASLGSIDIDGNGSFDLDTNRVYFAGSSLGSMVGGAFVAVNNNAAVQAKNLNLPKIQGVVLSSPAGSLTKIFENSPAIAPLIFGGLNLTQDASNLQKYQSMLQASLTSADVINFTDLLREDETPLMMYSMVGGGDCRAFNATTGSCSDGASRIPADFIRAFGGVYPPDHVFPNFDYFKSAETNPYVNVLPTLTYELNGTVTAFQHNIASGDALTGTTPLAQQMGLTQIHEGNIADNITAIAPNKKVFMPFDQGSHVTFITSDDSKTFTSMIAQMVAFFDSNGTSLNSDQGDSSDPENVDFTDGIAAEQTDYTPVAQDGSTPVEGE